MEVTGRLHAPAVLPPGKFVYWAMNSGWAAELVRIFWKIEKPFVFCDKQQYKQGYELAVFQE
jgi:hypothetical protein